MTAIEKAEDLFDKYWVLDDVDNYQFAKQCALICCDEVLGYMGADRGVEFWQEVKKEIEAI
jgi:hypothetical protein